MIAVESRVGRRIVGRLVPGEDVLRALSEVCRRFKIHAGEIRITGALRSADVCEYEQARRSFRPPRRLEAPMEILSLGGSVSAEGEGLSIQLMLTAARETDSGIQVFGGRLLGAAVFSCEFVVDTWDDLSLERKLDRDTGLMLWAEPRADGGGRAPGPAAGAPPPRAEAGVTWADAVAASTQKAIVVGDKPLAPPRSERPEEDLGYEPSTGDLVDHPQFGRCVVEVCDPADDRLVLRLPAGRLAELKLHVVTFLEPKTVEGKDVFPVRVRVRR
ncbi:MAG: DNA-binding protein [Deltaproteobacteria bacterium]|nr:DNA-binding protein [Deltaproteobacteria bacterium]